LARPKTKIFSYIITMNNPINIVTRHALAYFFSFFIGTLLVWIFVTPTISQLLTGTPTTIIIEPPGTFIWCGLYLFWFTFICFPVSIVAESIFLKRYFRWWAQVLIMIILFFLFGLVFWELFSIIFSGQFSFSTELLLYTFEGTILGTIYWLILQAGTLFFKRKSQSG
ncbi:MAG TPA: hypothetical protein PK078_06760, partial [Anaerolineales bacterium]|nr:hypothetical protein [Anaerolineales bacterium]HNB36808.1 hypothetical protein [Anaerolineales bacterium]